MSNIIDISFDQGSIDFHAVKSQTIFPVDAIIAKATEGITYSDANFRTYHDGAKAVGIPFSAYHFFHGGDEGIAQARHFLSTIDGYEGVNLPGVDCEEDGHDGVSAQVYLARLKEFVKCVDATLNGKRMVIYFDYAFWVNFLGGYDGFSGHPAWPAAYNNDPTLDMTGTGWKVATLWQYSNGSNVPSIPGIDTDVDRSRLVAGNLNVLRRV